MASIFKPTNFIATHKINENDTDYIEKLLQTDASPEQIVVNAKEKLSEITTRLLTMDDEKNANHFLQRRY